MYISDSIIVLSMCGGGCLFVYEYNHEVLIPCSFSVQSDLQSLMYCCCSVTDPGVPYTITVRAITTVGNGEPVSIVAFSVEQGKC